MNNMDKSDLLKIYTNIPGGSKNIYKVTLNRSPFVNKKSRDQLESREYFNRIVHSLKIPSLVSVIDYMSVFVSGAQVKASSASVSSYVTVKI